MADKEFKAIKVEKGPQGWGGPLTIKPSAEKDKIVAVTGGEIPKVAHRIAEMTGGTAVEGFRSPPPEEEMAAYRREAVEGAMGEAVRAGRRAGLTQEELRDILEETLQRDATNVRGGTS